MNVVIFIAYTGSQFTNSPGTFFRSAAQIPLHKMYTFVYRTFIKFILFCRGQALDVHKWGGIFTDDQMAAAMIDRLVHHGHLILFEGNSYRMEHALMKQTARQPGAGAESKDSTLNTKRSGSL